MIGDPKRQTGRCGMHVFQGFSWVILYPKIVDEHTQPYLLPEANSSSNKLLPVYAVLFEQFSKSSPLLAGSSSRFSDIAVSILE